MHAGGVQEQITSGGTTRALLTDGLGSVRGAADTSGALVGSADFDVFGAVRGTSTTGSSFGFTGEQTDPETGFSYLRSRYYNPSSGRFLSADSVQPNAEGTQGYNRYAYVANNPTTWTDPSGHLTKPQELVLFEMEVGELVVHACAETPWCVKMLLIGLGLTFIPESELQQWSGFGFTTFTLAACMLDIDMVRRPGPFGLQVGGGEHCFTIFLRSNGGWNCANQPMPCEPKERPRCPQSGIASAVQPELPWDLPCPKTPTPPPGCQGLPPGPYKTPPGLPDRPGNGKDFTEEQKQEILKQNWIDNGRRKTEDGFYIVFSDFSGEPMRVMPDFTLPLPHQISWPEIDHICPRSFGGTNSYSNACVLTNAENNAKSDTPRACKRTAQKPIPPEWRPVPQGS